MATAYTNLLGLALPVQGELDGTWGDTVNDAITSLLDSAVAGTTTLSSDADVTLSTTDGSSNQARQAILLCTGSRTASRTITAPAQSKAYIVINSTSGGFDVNIVGAGPTTGVTITNGTKALVAWNGADFVVVASSDHPTTTGDGASGTWDISITGNAATATTATNVGITNTGSNANFYIPFVTSSSTGTRPLGADASLIYNPSTNRLDTVVIGAQTIYASLLDFNDSSGIYFGSSDDAKFFYDGSNNTMEMELEAAANSFIITDNGTTRFTFTKSTGDFDAGGAVTATSFSGDGSSLTNVIATDTTKLPLSGGTMTGAIVWGTNDRNDSPMGTYDSYKTQQIWSIGAAYRSSATGVDFGSLYGAAYKYTNNTTGGTMAGGHQMVWCQNGTATASMGDGLWTSGNVTAYSDIRVKTNLEVIPNAVEKVKQLNGYTFDRTDVGYDGEGNPTIPVRQTGVVAQEVLKVLPEAVTGDEETHYSVAYGNMVGLLIEAIKEQDKKIQKLESLVDKLIGSSSPGVVPPEQS